MKFRYLITCKQDKVSNPKKENWKTIAFIELRILNVLHCFSLFVIGKGLLCLCCSPFPEENVCFHGFSLILIEVTNFTSILLRIYQRLLNIQIV